MSKHINKLILVSKIILLSIIFYNNQSVLLYSQTSKQSIILKGIISDSLVNLPLISSNIRISNTEIGTKSDIKGNFSLQIDFLYFANNIEINYPGYQKYTKTISSLLNSLETKLDNDILYLEFKLVPNNFKSQSVIISASKNVQNSQDIPISVSIIESDFIKSRSQNSLERILQYIPGVEVNNDNISLRGSSGFTFGIGSRVSLLLDGFPMLAADNGDMKFDALPFYNIERIEVIKGSGSALYGTSAIGGVINIITSPPTEDLSIKSRLFSGFHSQPNYDEWKFDGGNLINSGVDLNISQKIDNFSYTTSLTYFNQNGYRLNDKAERYAIFSKLYYNIEDKTFLDFTINHTNNQQENWVYWKSLTQPFLPDTYPANSENNTSIKTAGILNLKHIINEDNYLVLKSGVYNTYFNNNVILDNNTLRKSDANSINIDAQYNSKINEDVFITFGINNITNLVNSITYGNNNQNIFSTYFQSELNHVDNLIVTIGARLDLENTSNLNNNLIFSPKLGLNYNIWDQQFRLSAGRGFRAPSIAERFSNINFQGFSVEQNLSLKAEESISFEIGTNKNLIFDDYSLNIDCAVFYNKFNNFIDPSININSENVPVIQFKNIVDAQILGMELSVKQLFFNFIGFESSLTLMDPRDLVTNTTLKYRSKLLWYNRLILPITKSLQFQADYRYKERVENIDENLKLQISDYDFRVPINVVDFRVLYDINIDFDLPIKLALNVNNAFNYYFVEMVGSLAPTRFVNFQLEYAY